MCFLKTAFLQVFHLPEMGYKSAQWEKVRVSDSLRYGKPTRDARAYQIIISRKNAGTMI